MNKNDVSKFTLGTVQLGRRYGIGNKTGKPSKDAALKILRYAVSNGIESLDTAPDYGDSEKIIGYFIKEQMKQRLKIPSIITKVPSVQLHEDAISSNISKFVEETIHSSIKSLQIPSIDTCFIHNPNDITSYKGQVISSLSRLKEKGLINKIGASVYTPKEVQMVISLECFNAIQVPINIFDQRLIDMGLIEQLHKKKIDVFARSVYLQGLFFLDPDKLPRSLVGAQPYLLKLRKLSKDTGLSISEIALLFIRDVKHIDRIIIGNETINQLKVNIDLMKKTNSQKDLIKHICSQFNNVPEKLLNPTLWYGG